MAEGERTPFMTQQGGSFDKALIRELAALLDETGLTEIGIEHEGRRIRVARGGKAAFAAELPEHAPREARRSPSRTEEFIVHPGTVTSPMVGTAYRSAEPGAPPFVAIGSKGAAGQALLLIARTQ